VKSSQCQPQGSDLARKISAVDETILPHRPAQVYAALLDFESYPKWWPWPLKVRPLGPLPVQLGTAIVISNGPLVKWTATIDSLTEAQAIEMRYGEGAWSGPTRWTLSPAEGGTRLIYEVEIEILPGWLKLLSRCIDFSAFHSRQMEKVFAGLAAHLASEQGFG